MEEVEEIIDRLRECHQSIPVPLELPDENQLVIVEEELLISIPRPMRKFLLQVSDVVYGSLEPVTAADPHLHTYLPEVAALAWSEGVPRHLIPLCEVDNNYYCVDPDGEVLYWRDGELSDENWPSVWHWVEEVWLDS